MKRTILAGAGIFCLVEKEVSPMSRGDGIFLKAAGAFGLPEETVPGVSRLTVTGRGRVMIEDQKGLLKYGPDEMVINGGHGMIKITGSGLELSAMTDMEMEVTGRIDKIEFLE